MSHCAYLYLLGLININRGSMTLETHSPYSGSEGATPFFRDSARTGSSP